MLLSSRSIRARLVARLGEKRFLAAYSIVALMFFVPLFYHYFTHRHLGPQLWAVPDADAVVAFLELANAIGLVMLVAGSDYDAAANIAPSDPRPSLPRLLAELCERTATHVEDVIRTTSAGLLLMTTGPYLAWLALDFLERLPGVILRPVPVTFGRFRYRSGIIARRSAEDLATFRHLEALVRDAALGAPT